MKFVCQTFAQFATTTSSSFSDRSGRPFSVTSIALTTFHRGGIAKANPLEAVRS